MRNAIERVVRVVADPVGQASGSAEQPEALRRFALADTSILHLPRTLSTTASAAAQALSRYCFPSYDGTMREGVDVLRHARPLLAPAGARALSNEVDRALEAFRRVSGTRAPQVFFGIVSTDQCRKFHVDYIALRMVVTLAGPGTEWVDERNVDRIALERFIEDVDDANRSIVIDRALVQHCKAGDWLLLKGAAWPGRERVGAVHRSPPIEASRLRRLVLILTMPRTRRAG
ncbi:MAG: DUF1826 domain-containing protein [Myxococcales bacterium]|nr:DUF1826 domain-containing protein [Myxococcales bacterium]